MKKNLDYEISSGNVFADLGLPNPEMMLAKAELVRQIDHLIEQKGLNQNEAAKLLGVDQLTLSALVTGKRTFSFEELFRFLNLLGQDVTITITDASLKGNPTLRVI